MPGSYTKYTVSWNGNKLSSSVGFCAFQRVAHFTPVAVRNISGHSGNMISSYAVTQKTPIAAIVKSQLAQTGVTLYCLYLFNKMKRDSSDTQVSLCTYLKKVEKDQIRLCCVLFWLSRSSHTRTSHNFHDVLSTQQRRVDWQVTLNVTTRSGTNFADFFSSQFSFLGFKF